MFSKKFNKNIFHYAIAIQILCLYNSYSVALPYFAPEAKKYGLKSSLIGFVLASYAIGGSTAGLFMGLFGNNFSKKKLLILFETVLVLATLIMGFSVFAETKFIFTCISFLGRFV